MTKRYQLGKLIFEQHGDFFGTKRPYGFQPTLDEACLLEMGAVELPDTPEEIPLIEVCEDWEEDDYITLKLNAIRKINKAIQSVNRHEQLLKGSK